MKYLRFDATDCGFPKPRVPILPALSRHSLGRARPGLFSPSGPESNTGWFTRGRYALAQAYRQCGIGENGALLAPAYHCRTMLDPAIRMGAEIVLYSLKSNLAPDLETLTTSRAAGQQPVKAMLVTHYFGFSQSLERIADFCAKHDVALIEDCSHALVFKPGTDTVARNGAMGKTGRFCVASPYKFFPSEDGGLLWTNGGEELPPDQQLTPSWRQELRSLLHSARRARDQTHAPELGLIDDEIKAAAAKLSLTGRDDQQHDTGTSKYYLATDESRKGLACSHWFISHTNVERLAMRRRLNYRQWLTGVAGLPHCRALFPTLPPDCVPYMFPLVLDHPEVHFFALKQLGVPVWRWDDIAASSCPVASSYRLKLLHLPCHQELSAQQMTWMTTVLEKVMIQLPAGSR